MSRRSLEHMELVYPKSSSKKEFDHLGYGAGAPPYLRGPYASMYLKKPWTLRQYAGFSTAEESNEFYKNNLKGGQTGLSVAFDLPTHRGYDSDCDHIYADVGKSGVAIDTVEDMELLFKDIPLGDISVSMTMNGAVLPIMAFYICCALKQGVALSELRGTLQNDILKEFMVRNTYIYPEAASMKIVSDIISYCSEHMPKFNPISISGYHMLEAGAPADVELAYTLADGLEYVETALATGMNIDDFAPRLSFFFGIGMDQFTEIAKLRAARVLWANLMSEFNPDNPKSLMLRTHCQTSGWSLTAQNPLNNICRTTLEATAAVLGGTQSLHTNALDEAMTLPTPKTAKIARDTQLHLQLETKITKTVDPFGGSYILEQLTDELLQKATKQIELIRAAGGMTAYISKGTPKREIAKAAIEKQAQIDSGRTLIIGLNSYTKDTDSSVKILKVDHQMVRDQQLKRIEKRKATRSEESVQQALEKLYLGAKNKKGNLLDLSVTAAQQGATLGEISYALEGVYGRYSALASPIKGVYLEGVQQSDDYKTFKKELEHYIQEKGRAPRILMSKMGQDGHDRGYGAVASALKDLGFELHMTPLFQLPQEVASKAVELKADAVSMTSLTAGHSSLIPQLKLELQKQNSKALVLLGGIIPKAEYKELHKKGVDLIFGPGTNILKAASQILKHL